MAVAFGMAAATAQAAEPWMEQSIQLLQKESQIVDALFNQDSSLSLWVSLIDDGTRRDGFAEFVCVVLYEAGMPVGGFTVIHIWDAEAMNAGNMREIGRFDCERK